jgi:acyl-CoA synthetase (AMP-forming)/AMP-acid ligase II/pyrroloquinoline quinone (PQQ) biosynthesis protein C
MDLIAQQAKRAPDRPALQSDTDTISYSALWLAVEQMAKLIEAADPGDRPVGIDVPNGIDWVVADLALLIMGRVAVPIPSFYSRDQAHAALADAGASLVIDAIDICRLAHEPVALPPGTAKVSYTSGSTGAPKGICLSEGNLAATALAVIDRLGQGNAGLHLPILPLGVLLENVAGLYASLIAGGTYLVEDLSQIGLRDPFRPDFAAIAQAIAVREATSLILVPELLRGLTGYLRVSGERLGSLTLVAVGGATIPVELLKSAAAVGLPVVQGYGLTEFGSVVALETPGELDRGSVGTPLNHVEVTIAEDGEIILHGSAHLGSVGHPRGNTSLATGDLGRLDPQGRLWVTGRKSNLIITAFGRNISPEWLEADLTANPQVAQAMIYGDGEPSLSALIVPSTATTDPSPALTALNDRLPPYARIEHWELARPFLPRDGTATANGRPLRAAILARQQALPFFDRLVFATAAARGRMLSIPQLSAGLRGEISLPTYLAYLAQAYHHVSHTVPLMQAARARLSDRPQLVAALDDYIKEETGHEQWILDDIKAAGGDTGKAAADGPSPATAAMVDHAYRTIEQGNPAAFFGMVFVLESTSIALAQQGADAVRTALGLPPEAFRYLVSHGALDQDHLRFFEQLVNRLDDPADAQAILQMANDVFDLFGGIFATIPMEQPHAVT